MATKLELYFSSTWVEYEMAAESFEISEVLHNKLKMVDTVARLEVVPSGTLLSNLYGATADIPLRITDGATTIFTGFVRRSFAVQKRAPRVGLIPLEAVAESYLLRRKIPSDISYVGQTVTQVITALCVAAGVGSYSLPTVSTVLPIFTASARSTTWHDLISKLLFEYGYGFTITAAGALSTYPLFPNSVSYGTNVFSPSNCLDTVVQQKQETEVEKVIVAWSSVKTVEDAVVFSDTTDAGNGNKCNITIPASGYLGPVTDSHEWFADYDSPKGEVLYAADLTLDIVKAAEIVVDTFTAGPRRALLKIRNSSAVFARNVTKLDILAGTLIVKEATNKSIVELGGDTEKILEYESSFIMDATSADALAAGISAYYNYADFTYGLTSETDIALGALALVSDPDLGDNVARIIERKRRPLASGVISYVLEGVAEWTPGTATQEAHQVASPAAAAMGEALSRPTHEELQNGYEAGGGTMTPAVTTGGWSAIGAERGVVIRMDRQAALTNFKQNEVQVQDPADSKWYAPVSTGSPWHGATEDAVAVFTGSSFYHLQLPLDTDAGGCGIPTEYTYRTRRRTLADAVSAWSDPITVEALPVGAGALAANSIVADMIAVDVLTALIATVSEKLIISDSLGWQAGGISTPAIGDLRAVHTEKGFKVEYYNGSAWQMIFTSWGSYEDGVVSAGVSLGAGTFRTWNGSQPPFYAQNPVLCPNVNADQCDGMEGREMAPAGAITMYGGASAPTGWLLCNGAAVSRSTYAALFAAIGTNYGAGNGSTTFNLPDFRGIFPKGAGTTDRAAGKDAAGNFYSGTLGAYALDKFQGHKDTVGLRNNALSGAASVPMSGDGAATATITSSSPVTDGANGTPRTGSSTEPQSLGVCFIIKT